MVLFQQLGLATLLLLGNDAATKQDLRDDATQAILTRAALAATEYKVALGLDTLGPSQRDFPNRLLRGLESKKTQERRWAAAVCLSLTTVARNSAKSQTESDRVAEARFAFGAWRHKLTQSLRLLVDDADAPVASIASTILLGLGDNSHGLVKQVLAELNHVNAERRVAICEAIHALGLANPQLGEAVVRAVYDAEPTVARAAAHVVADMTPIPDGAVAALVGLLRRGDTIPRLIAGSAPHYRNPALRGLTNFGPEAHAAAPHLIDLLGRVSPESLPELLDCLAAIGPAAKACLPKLERFLFDKNHNIRLHAAAAALKIIPRHSKAGRIVEEALRDKDHDVRLLAIAVCRGMGKDAAPLVGILQLLLEDDDHFDDWRVSLALAACGPAAEPAIPALERQLTCDNDFLARRNAGRALASIGVKGMPALLRHAQDLGEYGCEESLFYLGGFPEEARLIVPVLVQALSKGNTSERLNALIALGRFGDKARDARDAIAKCVHAAGESHPLTDEGWNPCAAWAMTRVNK